MSEVAAAAPAAPVIEAPAAAEAPAPAVETEAKSPSAGVAPLSTKPATNREKALEKARAVLKAQREEGKKKPTETVTKAEEPAKAEPEKTEAAEEPAKPAAKTEAELKAIEDENYRKLRQKQKRQRENERALVTQRTEFEQRSRALQTEQESDARLKASDPDKWLAKHEFDFREVAMKAVQNDIPPEEKAKRDKESALEAELKELREWRMGQVAKEQERARLDAVKELHGEAAAAWPLSKANYPTLAEHYTIEEISEAATDLRVDHFKKTKEEAPLRAVFAHMEKNAKQQASRFTQRQNAERAERATASVKTEETRAATRPTVTNRDSATRTSAAAALTREERRQLAIEKAEATGSWNQ